MAGWRLRRAECRYPLMFPRCQHGEGGMVGGGTLRHVTRESILHKRGVFLVGPKLSLRPLKCTVYKIIAKAESHFSFIPSWAPWPLAPGAESQGG